MTVPGPVHGRPSHGRMLLRGLRRRCPRCGTPGLFRWWVSMADRCPRCGLRFEREEGFTLGVIWLNLTILSLFGAAYLVVGFALTVPDPPVGALTAGGVVGGGVLAVLTYPVAKTTWAAIDLAMRPVDVTEEAEALTWLAARDAPRSDAP